VRLIDRKLLILVISPYQTELVISSKMRYITFAVIDSSNGCNHYFKCLQCETAILSFVLVLMRVCDEMKFVQTPFLNAYVSCIGQRYRPYFAACRCEYIRRTQV